jgi:hypothetical protein
MKSIKTALVAGLVLVPTLAMAFPAMLTVFQSNYKPAASSELGKAKCATCHIGKTTRMNPYGKDLVTALAGGNKLTPAVLAKVETKDSDGDGINNITEI